MEENEGETSRGMWLEETLQGRGPKGAAVHVAWALTVRQVQAGAGRESPEVSGTSCSLLRRESECPPVAQKCLDCRRAELVPPGLSSTWPLPSATHQGAH